MLKHLLYLVLFISAEKSISQILYSERFNNLTLNSGTITGTSNAYLYSDLPTGMVAINTSTLAADTLTGNYPFRANGQKQKAWLSYKPFTATDTFAVSTSWVNPSGTASAWMITPPISSITVNSVLSWEAMAPDFNNPDGYEVYAAISTTNSPLASDFTTPLFSTSAEKNSWQTHGISLSSFAGQTIRIAFKNNSSNKYQLWVDDIVVSQITNAYDVSALSHSVYKYSSVNSNNTMAATFKNHGYTPITNLTLKYRMENGSTVTETKIISPPLNYLESRTLTFTQPFSSTTPIYTTFKIWADLINGQADEFIANDTIAGSITVSSSVPPKKVLVEQFTSSTCGWCPEGYSVLKTIAATNTNVIAASHHIDDNMSTASGVALKADYATDLPSATIDQVYFPTNQNIAINRESWNTYISQRLAMKTPATVTITNISYNTVTRQLDATVSTAFVGDVKGDYRLNLYVKENNVYGPTNDNSDNQWNQHSFLFNIGSSPYYQIGSYLNSNTYLLNPSQFKHQYVINELTDGPYGAAGIIPINGPTQGLNFSKNYSITLPTATNGEFRYNADNIYLIGVVTEYNADTKSRSVLNAAEVKLTPNQEVLVGINELKNPTVELTLFPNPATEECYLSYHLNQNEMVTVNIYNALGELVSIETRNAYAGDVIHALNVNELRAGNYSVQVSFKNNVVTRKLTIIK
jgi:hypothetical protein